MRLLLIAPNSFEFSHHTEQVVTDLKSFNDILSELLGKKADILIIPAEQTINSCVNNNFSGIEIIKHIRLTPELKNINKLPIVLLHWHSLDYYISKDQENIFLYSPAIYKHRLPHGKIDVNEFSSLNEHENLSPYIFGSEKDEALSDHTFRNKIAIKQFQSQIEFPSKKTLDKPLWYKKIFYKNYHNIKIVQGQVLRNNTLKNRIMIIDDLADAWRPAILKLFPNSEFTSHHCTKDALKIFWDIQVRNQTDFSTLNKSDKSQCLSFSSVCLKSLYDFVLLDIYFDNKEESFELSAGYQFLIEIEKLDIDIPIYIFSASNKDFSSIFNRFNFIIGRYIKGFTPLNLFVGRIADFSRLSKLFSISTNIKQLNNFLNNKTSPVKRKNIDKNGKINLSNLSIDEVLAIQLNLNSIIIYIHLFVKNYNPSQKIENNKRLLEILGLFGIIQEFRLWKDVDCLNIKLSYYERELIEMRNVAYHSNSNLYPYANNLFKKWNNLTVDEQIVIIEDAMKQTFDGLLFGI